MSVHLEHVLLIRVLYLLDPIHVEQLSNIASAHEEPIFLSFWLLDDIPNLSQPRSQLELDLQEPLKDFAS